MTVENHIGMKSLWGRIETWFLANTPPGRYILSQGASESQIRSTEQVIGVELPLDVRESYRLHNGSDSSWVLIVGPFLSLEEMAMRWQSWHVGLENGYFEGPDFVNEPASGIKPDWFNNKWLPVSDNQNGDYIYIDLDPAQGGHVGQVIEFTRDEGATRIIADSFRSWIEKIVCELETGVYRYDDSDGCLKRV